MPPGYPGRPGLHLGHPTAEEGCRLASQGLSLTLMTLERHCTEPSAAESQTSALNGVAQVTPQRRSLDSAGRTYEANRRMKSRQVWATSCHPESMVREWPRPAISSYSVTACSFFFCFLYDAFAMASGT